MFRRIVTTSKAASAAQYPQTAGMNICGEDIKTVPMIIPNFPNMRKPKIGGNFEEQKATAKQPKHPTAPRNRGHNRIFTQDRFERGGLFQYQAEQYFGNVGGGTDVV